MVFYNILRIVKSVLYRTPKKILITIIIGLVLFMFNSHVFGATVTDVSGSYKDDEGRLHIATNQYEYLYNRQKTAQLEFISVCMNHKDEQFDQIKTALTPLWEDVRNLGTYGKSVFVETNVNPNDPQMGYRAGVVLLTNITDYGIYNYGVNSNTYVDDVRLVNATFYQKTTFYANNFYAAPMERTDVYPYDFFLVFVPEWIDLFKTFGFISDKDDEVIALLTQIANKSEQDYSNALAQVNQNLENIDSSVKDTNQSIKDMQNSITDSTVNAPINDLPKDNTQDITDGGFNQIFELLRTTFTTSEPKDLVVELPFVNKSFTINSANVYGNADLGIVKVLIQSFWYFVFCYFIVQDISIKINKLKSGNIEDVQTDNVKEDIL